MSVRKKEQVFTLAIHRELRIVLQNMKVQGHKKLRTAKRTARVPGLTIVHHANNIPANLGAELLQFYNVWRGHSLIFFVKIALPGTPPKRLHKFKITQRE